MWWGLFPLEGEQYIVIILLKGVLTSFILLSDTNAGGANTNTKVRKVIKGLTCKAQNA